MRPKLLLHTCCASCSIYVLDQLAHEYDLTIFFYDPNIHPRKEYNLRRDEMKNYAKKIGLKFEEGEYNSSEWFKKTKGLENEPERGRRCDACFDLRLSKTATKAKAEGYDTFATVLSISPHKDYAKISMIGQSLANQLGIEFLDRDWKKKDGFKISSKMSKEEGFYRQDYCGCVYSKRN
ncbi:epoxyqueuosine reductase QueH [Patescibacteria group bacterium]|nr:epoxyqueuosine reductase QueH [Patescibacteria group bacterium]